ncbi:hypothetical protein [Thiohalorhabdus sp.]|uniref:hypothetical protein n=1 Tax=Thiohalorhabdus sp. TaxID=3094134 RepID=UPI002FC3A9F6
MCVCESDLIKMKLHLITRRYYPGIKYNEAVLGQFAQDLGIAVEREIRQLPEPEQADLAARVYDRLADAGSAPPEEPSVHSSEKVTAPV